MENKASPEHAKEFQKPVNVLELVAQRKEKEAKENGSLKKNEEVEKVKEKVRGDFLFPIRMLF